MIRKDKDIYGYKKSLAESARLFIIGILIRIQTQVFRSSCKYEADNAAEHGIQDTEFEDAA